MSLQVNHLSTLHECSAQECIAHLWRIFSRTTSDVSMLSVVNGDIDSFEKKLTEIARRVQTLKNTLLPIMRLPPEVLCMVFRMVQVEGSTSSRTFTPGATSYSFSADWIRVTHVCSRWREVALHCSSLWAFLDIQVSIRRDRSNPRARGQEYISGLLKASIERSRDAPLIVQVRMPASVSPAAEREIAALIPHLSRARELHISQRSIPFEAARVKTIMPDLHTLSYVPPLSQSNSDINFTFMNPSSIKYLSLSSHHNFTEHRFNNLKQLRLHGTTFGNAGHVQAFLDVLATNEQLEAILFSITTFDVRLTNSNHSSRISLPKLRTIAFHGLKGNEFSTFEAGFLAHIALPSPLALAATAGTDNGHFVEPCHLNDILASSTLGCSSLIDASTVGVSFIPDQTHCDITIISSSSAWRFEQCSISDPSTPGILHMARQLRVSFSSDNWFDDFSKARVLRTWLGAHNFEEVILSTTRCSEGVSWFLQELLPRDNDVSFVGVRTLRFHGIIMSRKLYQELLPKVLQERESLGYPIRKIVFYISSCSKEASDEERAIFARWKRHVPYELRSIPQLELEFVEVRKYPKPRLPPVCAPHDHEPWRWFDWSAIGDIEYA